eukprot:3164619-Pyramimonas_sp.AAC.1
MSLADAFCRYGCEPLEGLGNKAAVVAQKNPTTGPTGAPRGVPATILAGPTQPSRPPSGPGLGSK